MRISADFEDLESAVLAHKAVLKDAEVDPENIEIRSAWPLFEEPLPPHRHRPMRIRNIVRGLWVCGAIGGFSLASLAQLDYPIVTSGHPIVPIPPDVPHASHSSGGRSRGGQRRHHARHRRAAR
jgi:hypothetical protein